MSRRLYSLVIRITIVIGTYCCLSLSGFDLVSYDPEGLSYVCNDSAWQLDQNCADKRRAAPTFCPFAPVESFLIAKVSIGERRLRCWDIYGVVTWSLLAQCRVRTRVSCVSSRRSSLGACMTARSKLKEAASSLCPFAPVESLFVLKVSIGPGSVGAATRRRCWDI